jgi:NADH-quinone oxidoreductase subunit G
MVTDNKPSLISINVDGVEHQVVAGTNLVDALAKIGKEVTHYCYHPNASNHPEGRYLKVIWSRIMS